MMVHVTLNTTVEQSAYRLELVEGR